MQYKDFVKAAKELNKLAGTTIKVVAIKGADLQKAIQDAVPTLTDFDFSTLSDPTLDTLDELKCEMPEGDLPIAEDLEAEGELVGDGLEKDNKDLSSDESLVAAGEDLIDVLGLPKEDVEKFEKLDFKGKVKELQKMADVINEPYEEDGKTINPNDKPEDFKHLTIKVFEANGIKVKWNEEVKEEEPAVKEKKQKRSDPVDKKKEPKEKKAPKPKKEKVVKEKKQKYTRIDAFCDVMKEKNPLTKAEINDEINKKYGGEPRDQSGNINFMLSPMIEFGLVVVSGEGKAATFQLK